MCFDISVMLQQALTRMTLRHYRPCIICRIQTLYSSNVFFYRWSFQFYLAFNSLFTFNFYIILKKHGSKDFHCHSIENSLEPFSKLFCFIYIYIYISSEEHFNNLKNILC